MADSNNASKHSGQMDESKHQGESTQGKASSSQVSGCDQLPIGGSDTSSVGSSRKFYRSAEKRSVNKYSYHC